MASWDYQGGAAAHGTAAGQASTSLGANMPGSRVVQPPAWLQLTKAASLQLYQGVRWGDLGSPAAGGGAAGQSKHPVFKYMQFVRHCHRHRRAVPWLKLALRCVQACLETRQGPLAPYAAVTRHTPEAC